MVAGFHVIYRTADRLTEVLYGPYVPTTVYSICSTLYCDAGSQSIRRIGESNKAFSYILLNIHVVVAETAAFSATISAIAIATLYLPRSSKESIRMITII